MKASCYHCGKEFNCSGSKKYCSVECRKTASRERIISKQIEYKECPVCGKLFSPESRSDQIYCSSKCLKKNKANKNNILLTERICVVCGLSFMPTQNKQICCSAKCVYDRHYSINSERKKKLAIEWRKNNPERAKENDRRKRERDREKYRKIEKNYHDKTRFSGNRELVLERDGHKCVECGATEKLAVHHKDHTGQTENRNDDINNLVTLCSVCHGKKHGKPIIKPERHITAKCSVCGKEFQTTTDRIEGGRGKYCSAECQKKRNSKTNTVTLNCEYCGKEFTVPLSRYKRGKVKYDSMECRRAAGYAWTNKQTTN